MWLLGRAGDFFCFAPQDFWVWGVFYARVPPREASFFKIFFDFIQWKPTDTWPRDRCGRAQLVLLPSLVESLHLGADL